MLQTQVLSGPASTKRILANLSLAIDEAKLVQQIVNFDDQIRRIEYQPEQAARVRFMKREISNLNEQLSEVRKQAL